MLRPWRFDGAIANVVDCVITGTRKFWFLRLLLGLQMRILCTTVFELEKTHTPPATREKALDAWVL